MLIHNCEDSTPENAKIFFFKKLAVQKKHEKTRIDGRNILQINDHDLLCSYFVCVFVFSFRLPFAGGTARHFPANYMPFAGAENFFGHFLICGAEF